MEKASEIETEIETVPDTEMQEESVTEAMQSFPLVTQAGTQETEIEIQTEKTMELEKNDGREIHCRTGRELYEKKWL